MVVTITGRAVDASSGVAAVVEASVGLVGVVEEKESTIDGVVRDVAVVISTGLRAVEVASKEDVEVMGATVPVVSEVVLDTDASAVVNTD